MNEIELKQISGQFLVPLSQKEINDKVERIKEINIELHTLGIEADQLVKEVESGRAVKQASCIEKPNYDTGKLETYYNGILISEVPMESPKQPENPAVKIPKTKKIEIEEDDCPL